MVKGAFFVVKSLLEKTPWTNHRGAPYPVKPAQGRPCLPPLPITYLFLALKTASRALLEREGAGGCTAGARRFSYDRIHIMMGLGLQEAHSPFSPSRARPGRTNHNVAILPPQLPLWRRLSVSGGWPGLTLPARLFCDKRPTASGMVTQAGPLRGPAPEGETVEETGSPSGRRPDCVA